MSKIAVIGIAGESVFLSVDNFGVTGETTVATSFYKELGGKGFNQAIAAARYGAEVSFLAACYQEDIENFSRVAEGCGVRPFFVEKTERSPYAVITTDKKGDNRVCVYRGAELTVSDVVAFSEEIKSADILLINNEIPIIVNEWAVKIAKENGVKIILNPAPQCMHERAYLEKIDLFTPNEYETVGLKELERVIVTLGDKGCLIKNTGEIIPAMKIKTVVDTTGAGDTFNGVLAACLAEGEELKTACQRANIAAAIKVGRKYILKSIPTREEIEQYEKEDNHG